MRIAFEEHQGFVHSRWMKAVVALSVAGALLSLVAALFTDVAPTDRVGAAVGGVVLAAVALLFYFLRLTVRVDDALRIAFRPFLKRVIPFEEIESAEAVTYRPLREYGGWGIRCGKKGRAYTVSGKEGVQLTLNGGKGLLLGSRRSEELARALQKRLGEALRPG